MEINLDKQNKVRVGSQFLAAKKIFETEDEGEGKYDESYFLEKEREKSETVLSEIEKERENAYYEEISEKEEKERIREENRIGKQFDNDTLSRLWFMFKFMSGIPWIIEDCLTKNKSEIFPLISEANLSNEGSDEVNVNTLSFYLKSKFMKYWMTPIVRDLRGVFSSIGDKIEYNLNSIIIVLEEGTRQQLDEISHLINSKTTLGKISEKVNALALVIINEIAENNRSLEEVNIKERYEDLISEIKKFYPSFSVDSFIEKFQERLSNDDSLKQFSNLKDMAIQTENFRNLIIQINNIENNIDKICSIKETSLNFEQNVCEIDNLSQVLTQRYLEDENVKEEIVRSILGGKDSSSNSTLLPLLIDTILKSTKEAPHIENLNLEEISDQFFIRENINGLENLKPSWKVWEKLNEEFFSILKNAPVQHREIIQGLVNDFGKNIFEKVNNTEELKKSIENLTVYIRENRDALIETERAILRSISSVFKAKILSTFQDHLLNDNLSATNIGNEEVNFLKMLGSTYMKTFGNDLSESNVSEKIKNSIKKAIVVGNKLRSSGLLEKVKEIPYEETIETSILEDGSVREIITRIKPPLYTIDNLEVKDENEYSILLKYINNLPPNEVSKWYSKYLSSFKANDRFYSEPLAQKLNTNSVFSMFWLPSMTFPGSAILSLNKIFRALIYTTSSISILTISKKIKRKCNTFWNENVRKDIPFPNLPEAVMLELSIGVIEPIRDERGRVKVDQTINKYKQRLLDALYLIDEFMLEYGQIRDISRITEIEKKYSKKWSGVLYAIKIVNQHFNQPFLSILTKNSKQRKEFYGLDNIPDLLYHSKKSREIASVILEDYYGQFSNIFLSMVYHGYNLVSGFELFNLSYKAFLAPFTMLIVYGVYPKVITWVGSQLSYIGVYSAIDWLTGSDTFMKSIELSEKMLSYFLGGILSLSLWPLKKSMPYIMRLLRFFSGETPDIKNKVLKYIYYLFFNWSKLVHPVVCKFYKIIEDLYLKRNLKEIYELYQTGGSTLKRKRNSLRESSTSEIKEGVLIKRGRQEVIEYQSPELNLKGGEIRKRKYLYELNETNELLKDKKNEEYDFVSECHSDIPYHQKVSHFKLKEIIDYTETVDVSLNIDNLYSILERITEGLERSSIFSTFAVIGNKVDDIFSRFFKYDPKINYKGPASRDLLAFYELPLSLKLIVLSKIGLNSARLYWGGMFLDKVLANPSRREEMILNISRDRKNAILNERQLENISEAEMIAALTQENKLAGLLVQMEKPLTDSDLESIFESYLPGMIDSSIKETLEKIKVPYTFNMLSLLLTSLDRHLLLRNNVEKYEIKKLIHSLFQEIKEIHSKTLKKE